MPLSGRKAIESVLVVSAAICAVVGNGCAQVVDTNGVGGKPTSGADAAPDAPGSVTPIGSDASACSPGDVGAFQPDPYHPATAAWQNVCRPEQITGFYDACLGPHASPA